MIQFRLGCLCVALAAGLSLWSGEAPARPNIVFILADDLGYMDIGAYNPKAFYETPHIDALAARGMKFTQGYAACPVCSPTRGSILTGKYPPRFGVTDFIGGNRSEEHTSELQSRGLISCALFCLRTRRSGSNTPHARGTAPTACFGRGAAGE